MAKRQLCRSATTALLGVCLLALAGCPQSETERLAEASDRGKKAAETDVANGILKQKEYPPMPYSLQQMNYIRLLKNECGVDNEVVSAPRDSKELRSEVAAYNAVMQSEIARQFGADIFAKLKEKANAPPKQD
jgi:hypothetical protein